jgi:hypothetical protein
VIREKGKGKREKGKGKREKGKGLAAYPLSFITYLFSLFYFANASKILM